MPINPNIALGVRPIEQPNILGQMAQVMAIRQANQEYENEGGLRNALAGGLPDDTSSLLQYGNKGRATYESILKGKKEQLESSQKRIDMLGGLAGFVRERPTPENFASSLDQAVSYGLMTPAQKQQVITQYGGSPESIRAYADQTFQSALTAKDRTANETRLESSRISAGPANARLAQEQKERAEADLLFGRPTTTAPVTVPMGGGGGVPSAVPMSAPAGGGVPNALPATVGVTPAAPVANMLMPGAQTPATTPATAPASAPAFAPMGDQFQQIKDINAEITRLRPYMSNPRVAANVQQLNTERTQLMASAEREYGGNLVDMSIENPEKPGTYITVKGKLDQYGIAQPLKTGAMPKAIDVTSGTSINLPVARPAPRVGYQYNNKGEEVKIPQTGVPEGVKIKPGERWNEEKQMVEQIPGSAAFIEQQTKHGKDLGALKTTQATTKWGTERIDKILDPKNKTGFENNFGGFTAYATKELSGNTALVKSELDSLKSDLKNKGLQMFRAGGSIGAMTEKEWPIVESMLATITPKMDVKDARDVLEAVRAKFEALENLAAEKYNDQWKNTQYYKSANTSGTAPALTGEDKAAMDWANANPKDPRAAQIRQRLGG